MNIYELKGMTIVSTKKFDTFLGKINVYLVVVDKSTKKTLIEEAQSLINFNDELIKNDHGDVMSYVAEITDGQYKGFHTQPSIFSRNEKEVLESLMVNVTKYMANKAYKDHYCKEISLDYNRIMIYNSHGYVYCLNNKILTSGLSINLVKEDGDSIFQKICLNDLSVVSKMIKFYEYFLYKSKIIDKKENSNVPYILKATSELIIDIKKNGIPKNLYTINGIACTEAQFLES